MTKKEKQEHKSPAEVKEALMEEKEQVTDKECALELEETLKKYNRALQPFLLEPYEFGIVPRVRLVRVAPESDDTNVEETAA